MLLRKYNINYILSIVCTISTLLASISVLPHIFKLYGSNFNKTGVTKTFELAKKYKIDLSITNEDIEKDKSKFCMFNLDSNNFIFIVNESKAVKVKSTKLLEVLENMMRVDDVSIVSYLFNLVLASKYLILEPVVFEKRNTNLIVNGQEYEEQIISLNSFFKNVLVEKSGDESIKININ